VTELRFHSELYAAAALDEAVARFAGFGVFDLIDEGSCRLLRIEARGGVPEAVLAGEVANFALGRTVQLRQPMGAKP
jgi:hypothetical protein